MRDRDSSDASRLLFAVPCALRMDHNTVYARICMIMRDRGVAECYVFDRESHFYQFLLDSNGALSIGQSVALDQLKTCVLVPLDGEAGILALETALTRINRVSLYFVFDSVYNEDHHWLNVAAERFFGDSVGWVIKEVKRLGILEFYFALRRHGFYSSYGSRKFYSGIATDVHVFTDIALPTWFWHTRIVRVYQASILEARQDDYRFSPEAPNHDAALVLGDSPSHMDHSPDASSYKLSESMAERLGKYLMTESIMVDILPHPRDLFFADELESITGYKTIRTRPYPKYSKYFVFPSSYLSVLLSSQARANIALLAFRGSERLARGLANKYSLRLLTIS